MTTQINTNATNLPEVSIDISLNGASTLLSQVNAMPENTKEEVAAKWLKMKEIENAGTDAKSSRTRLGNKLYTDHNMIHESRVIVNGQSYKFSNTNGTSSGIKRAAIDSFKARYSRLPYIGRAIEQEIARQEGTYPVRKLTVG